MLLRDEETTKMYGFFMTVVCSVVLFILIFPKRKTRRNRLSASMEPSGWKSEVDAERFGEG